MNAGSETVTGRRRLFATALIVLFLPLLSGCTSLLEEDVPIPSADLKVWPDAIQQGESITFDARSSEPISGVLTSFTWDFGDGSVDETLIGFTSHRYNDWGYYEVKVTVENDRGGTDTATADVHVNGVPVIDLDIPDQVKSGDIAVLDASRSFDPEGGDLDYTWDLDWSVDSDDDGNPRNDVDSNASRIELPTGASGQILGGLMVEDVHGGVSEQAWTLEILTRNFQIEWTERTVVVEDTGYLEEGASWQSNSTPGLEGLILSVEAVLELERDLIEPQDNFSLTVEVVEAFWTESVMTSSSSNITSNESAKAELSREDINTIQESMTMTADSKAALLQRLLNPTDSNFGQVEWLWSITAEQADPDAPLGQGFDPDSGNDWTLTVTYTILVPTLTEIAQ